MKSQNIAQWQKQNTKEMFSLSNQLLDFIGQFHEYQMREAQSRLNYCMEYAQYVADGAVGDIKKQQMETVIQSADRLARFHKNARHKIGQIHQQVETKSGEAIHKSIDMLTEFIEEGDRKLPMGAKNISHAVRVASELGDKAYRSGVIGAGIVLEHTDHFIEKYIDDSDAN